MATIDYKDLATLKNYVTETGKIVPSRITGTKSFYQRQLARRSSARASWRCCPTPISTEAAPWKSYCCRRSRTSATSAIASRSSSGYGRNYLLPQGQGDAGDRRATSRASRRGAPSSSEPANDELTDAKQRAEALERLQADHHAPRPAPKASCSARSAPPTSPRRRPRPATSSRAAKCACPNGPLRAVGEQRCTLHLHADVDVELPVIIVAEEAGLSPGARTARMPGPLRSRRDGGAPMPGRSRRRTRSRPSRRCSAGC